MKCSYQKCLSASQYFCDCKNSGLLFCSEHLTQHIYQDSITKHLIQAITNDSHIKDRRNYLNKYEKLLE